MEIANRNNDLTESNIFDYIESKLRFIRSHGHDIRTGSVVLKETPEEILEVMYYTDDDLVDDFLSQTSLFVQKDDKSSFAIICRSTYKSAFLSLEPRFFGEELAIKYFSKSNIDQAFKNYELVQLKKPSALDCLSMHA